jgi:hypothetical protein
MKDKVRLGQARLSYVRFLDEFESPGLPGSLKKIIRVIKYFKIEYFVITTLNGITMEQIETDNINPIKTLIPKLDLRNLITINS